MVDDAGRAAGLCRCIWHHVLDGGTVGWRVVGNVSCVARGNVGGRGGTWAKGQGGAVREGRGGRVGDVDSSGPLCLEGWTEEGRVERTRSQRIWRISKISCGRECNLVRLSRQACLTQVQLLQTRTARNSTRLGLAWCTAGASVLRRIGMTIRIIESLMAFGVCRPFALSFKTVSALLCACVEMCEVYVCACVDVCACVEVCA